MNGSFVNFFFKYSPQMKIQWIKIGWYCWLIPWFQALYPSIVKKGGEFWAYPSCTMCRSSAGLLPTVSIFFEWHIYEQALYSIIQNIQVDSGCWCFLVYHVLQFVVCKYDFIGLIIAIFSEDDKCMISTV